MSTRTTAQSQVLAVCCVAIVARRAVPITAPCPSMREWARSPALVRQWADDWVLPPLWDAVFVLPLVPQARESGGGQYLFHVSVSLTLGVLCHSWFACDSSEKVCGCIRDNRVLVQTANKVSLSMEYAIRDPAAWNDTYLPEASLEAWRFIWIVKCGKKWILGGDGSTSIHILRVVCGSPVGAEVVVRCRDIQSQFQFTPLGDDVIMFLERDEHGYDVVVFADLVEIFEKKQLVVMAKISCGTKWPVVTSDITWMPDGSACILLEDAQLVSTLVDPSKGNVIVQQFPHKEAVLPFRKNNVFCLCSKQSEMSTFEVFHTGDLAHPSLCVPCTWATVDRITGLILSTVHHNSREVSTEIEFSLHDGVSGIHIVAITSVQGFTAISTNEAKICSSHHVMSIISTAKSQVVAVCCAAIVGRRHVNHQNNSDGQGDVGSVPCPSMREWARSPALVRQWADDWVLSPLWDAVFRLPLMGYSGAGQNFFHVSVSLTLGVLCHSQFMCGIDDVMCGCIGHNRVLVQSIKKGTYFTMQYTVRDTAALDESHLLVGDSMEAWESISHVQCGKKWMIGRLTGGAYLYIHRVARGSPVGSDVVVSCKDFKSALLPRFTGLGDDVVMYLEGHRNGNDVLVFADLEESFEKKQLVARAKINCHTKWPAETSGITFMPDGSACIIVESMKRLQSVCSIVDPSKGNFVVQQFPEKKVIPFGKNHVFSLCSDPTSVCNFEVFHTGDLAHPSLCVPCTWATVDRITGLILSTVHSSRDGSAEIQFSLHDGVSGIHIGVFTTSVHVIKTACHVQVQIVDSDLCGSTHVPPPVERDDKLV
ncbi:hypothetical protein Pelo_3233 [Pelomyxa schiedti]|nr:hypothetical protein Pelo_3233 [Pelomyxa schiedti]